MFGKILGRILVVIYIAALAYLCFARVDMHILSSTWLGIPKDKIAHCIMFIPFAPLMALAFHKSTRRPWTMVGFLLIVIVLGMAIGGGIELIQSRLDYRSADILDFRADNVGLAIGVVLTFIWGAVSRKW